MLFKKLISSSRCSVSGERVDRLVCVARDWGVSEAAMDWIALWVFTSSSSFRMRSRRSSCVGLEVPAGVVERTGFLTGSSQAMPREIQLEHGDSLLQRSFRTLQKRQETGRSGLCNSLSLGIINALVCFVFPWRERWRLRSLWIVVKYSYRVGWHMTPWKIRGVRGSTWWNKPYLDVVTSLFGKLKDKSQKNWHILGVKEAIVIRLILNLEVLRQININW